MAHSGIDFVKRRNVVNGCILSMTFICSCVVCRINIPIIPILVQINYPGAVWVLSLITYRGKECCREGYFCIDRIRAGIKADKRVADCQKRAKKEVSSLFWSGPSSKKNKSEKKAAWRHKFVSPIVIKIGVLQQMLTKMSCFRPD